MATVVKVQYAGVRETLAALRKMEPEFKKAARVQAELISNNEARRIRAAASSRGQRMAARSVRARGGMSPAIEAGGPRRIRTHDRYGRTRSVRGSEVFFGYEFGAHRYPQFPPNTGQTGYFFWPTIRQDSEMIMREWTVALEKLQDTWTGTMPVVMSQAA